MRYKVCVNFVSFRYDWRLLLHPHYRDFLARDAALAAYLPHGVSSYADKLFSVFRCTYHGIGLGAVLWGSGLFGEVFRRDDSYSTSTAIQAFACQAPRTFGGSSVRRVQAAHSLHAYPTPGLSASYPEGLRHIRPTLAGSAPRSYSI